MITVTLAYPNGNRADELLERIPVKGDYIRTFDSEPEDPSLLVENVLLMGREGTFQDGKKAAAIIAVRPHVNGPL